MVDIRLLEHLNSDDLNQIVTGYTSDAKFLVRKTESAEQYVISLDLIPLRKPYVKRFDYIETGDATRYKKVLALGFSFGVYDLDKCVGIVLAEPREWNKSLWVWELHVAETHRQRGYGRNLVNTLSEKAQNAGLRIMVCETQNTNVPAIRFYHKVGFHVEGIDLSYYTNNDYPNGEIAVFMKKRLS